MSRTFAVLVIASSLVACGEPSPKTPQKGDEGVPANSLSETRLADGKDPKKTETSSDPTQPLMTPVGVGSSSGTSSEEKVDPKDAKKDPKKGDPKKPDAATKTGPVSRAECEAANDHALDVAIGATPGLADIPPEVLTQLKAQAKADAKASDNPCTKGISRAEYNCNMASSSVAELKKCDKKK